MTGARMGGGRTDRTGNAGRVLGHGQARDRGVVIPGAVTTTPPAVLAGGTAWSAAVQPLTAASRTVASAITGLVQTRSARSRRVARTCGERKVLRRATAQGQASGPFSFCVVPSCLVLRRPELRIPLRSGTGDVFRVIGQWGVAVRQLKHFDTKPLVPLREVSPMTVPPFTMSAPYRRD
jgi:hypothetical protein